MLGFASYPPWEPDPEELLVTSSQRLARFRDLGAQIHSQMLLILPPISAVRDGSDSVIRAGEKTGLTVVDPIRSGTLPLSDYRDGFHLNEVGRPLFTAALADAMKTALHGVKE
jgi:hypothetical protein